MTGSILDKYMKKLERALPDAFRFVENSSIAPNNYAECALRYVIAQKDTRAHQIRGVDAVDGPHIFMCYIIEEPGNEL